jgi:hypothetical protein
VTVWEWSGVAADEGDEAAAWFSKYLERSVRLVRWVHSELLHRKLPRQKQISQQLLLVETCGARQRQQQQQQAKSSARQSYW